MLELVIPARYDALEVLGASINTLISRIPGLNNVDVLSYNVQLAVHEVCTNIIDHAYAHTAQGDIRITMRVRRWPRSMTIDIDDRGHSFDPSNIPSPNLDVPQEHGYGLFLVRELMDEVSYRTDARGNHWRLTKNLRSE